MFKTALRLSRLALLMAVSVSLTARAAETPEADWMGGHWKTGDHVPSFYVRTVTGPLKNRSICYVCRFGGRPVVLIMAREVTPELTRLVADLDGVVDSRRGIGLRGCVVFLTTDAREAFSRVQTLGFNEKWSLPLALATVPADTQAGASKLQVVLYENQSVQECFDVSDARPDAETQRRIVDAAKKLGAH